MKRIAVLNTHPIQYFAPLYAYLNTSPDLEVEALYLSDISIRGAYDKGFGHSVKWDIDLLKGYPHKFIGAAAKHRSPNGHFLDLIAPEIWNVVRNGKYDALWLHGHAYAANMIALAAARSVAMPVMMRCETHLGVHRSAAKKALRGLVLPLVYRRCHRFLAIGSANRSFYLSLGLPEESVFSVPYTIDNQRFIEGARAASQRRVELRSSLGVCDELPVVLYLSKFQRHKRPHDLVAACGKLRRQGIDFHLLLGGSGEMQSELEQLIAAEGLTNARFIGFINQSSLPGVYAASDVFVLPSAQEPWGLVVNEAMCAGLPIVASDAIASADDLVRPGLNGARFAAGDRSGLAAALAPMLTNASLRSEMGKASLEIISNWSYRECLAGLLEATREL